MRRMFAWTCLILCACGDAARDDTRRPGTSTGNTMRADLIAYSSEQSLANVDQDVFVVGLDDWIDEPGGTLSIHNERSSTVVTVGDVGETFVATISARLGDTLQLRYVGPTGGTAAVDEDLDDALLLAAPTTSGGCPPPPAMCNLPPPLLGPRTADEINRGVVVVQLSLLIDPTPPYLVFNSNNGVSLATATADDVEIAAEVGDVVCVFSDDGSSSASPAACSDVPL